MKKILFLKYISKDSKGFTIIEALISLLIVSFALLGIFRIHLQAVKSTELNRRMTVAVEFGNSGVEQLRSLSYSDLTNGTTTESSSSAQDFSDPDLAFLREITISTVSGIKRTKKALVTIGWDTLGDCSGGAMSGCDNNVTFETYLTDLE
jgi:Tfp pilus assembly protein PilV